MPFPSSGDLPERGIDPRSLALQADSLPSEQPVLHSKRYLNQEGLKLPSFLLWEGRAWVRVCRQMVSTSAIPRPVPVAGINNGAPILPPTSEFRCSPTSTPTITLKVMLEFMLEFDMKLICYLRSRLTFQSLKVTVQQFVVFFFFFF